MAPPLQPPHHTLGSLNHADPTPNQTYNSCDQLSRSTFAIKRLFQTHFSRIRPHQTKKTHSFPLEMPSFKKKMDSRRLRNSDMKKLAQLLRGVPLPHHAGTRDTYPETTKDAIKRLPRRLRHSALLNLSTFTGDLCSMHKALDHHLMDDIWGWVKHEFSAIGRLLYPLIMSGKLTHSEAFKARQLEPVCTTGLYAGHAYY
jgi:hypothetical protein